VVGPTGTRSVQQQRIAAAQAIKRNAIKTRGPNQRTVIVCKRRTDVGKRIIATCTAHDQLVMASSAIEAAAKYRGIGNECIVTAPADELIPAAVADDCAAAITSKNGSNTSSRCECDIHAGRNGLGRRSANINVDCVGELGEGQRITGTAAARCDSI